MSINRVILCGNLTRDPELRTTAGGTAVLSFGIAVNERRRNPQTSEWEDVPNFFDCALFGRRADALSNILHKGMRVTLEGKLRWHQWETQDGQKRSKVDILVDEIEFMSPRNSDGGGSYTPPQNYQRQQPDPQASTPVQVPNDSVYGDSDIPF
jgi:single-strand DNA-binding protein